MKLFNRFSTRSKVLMSTALLLVAGAAVVTTAHTHAALGADRQTKAYVEGMPGFDHVQFDSFTGVPNIGDERQFFTGMIDGANTPFYDGISNVQNGDTMLVRVYVHNNADSSLNASGQGVAKNTRVRVVLPTNLAANQTAQAFISADNAQPQTIEDDFTVSGSSPVGLQYVPGSATIKTNYQDKAVSDDIVKSGVLIGDDNLSGNLPGCFQHVALVTFKVKVTAPGYSLQKQVRLNGDKNWTDKVTAKPGDKVDFDLAFRNTGGTQLNSVVIGDRLPVGLTYVPNSTLWYNSSTGNQWAKVTYDQWMKGGLNVGNYAAGGAVFVKFTAQVDDPSKLQCGLNRITNFGFAKPENQGTIQSSAEVDVTKVCQQETPVYSCDMLDISKNDTTKTVTVKTFNTTATGGASFKTVDINWGENGVVPLNTNNAVGKSHQYTTGNGPFTITATAHFSVPDKSDVTATSTSCVKTVSFTTPTTPVTPTTPQTPTVLPNTGAGNIAAIFAVTTVLGALVHRFVLSRRFAR